MRVPKSNVQWCAKRDPVRCKVHITAMYINPSVSRFIDVCLETLETVQLGKAILASSKHNLYTWMLCSASRSATSESDIISHPELASDVSQLLHHNGRSLTMFHKFANRLYNVLIRTTVTQGHRNYTCNRAPRLS